MGDLLPPAAPDINQQIACVTREIGMRRKVYPRWTDAGKITKAKADHDVACMEQVLVTLQHVKQGGTAP